MVEKFDEKSVQLIFDQLRLVMILFLLIIYKAKNETNNLDEFLLKWKIILEN
jgi:hypothetical protein